MGDTPLSAPDVAAVLFELCRTWRGADYDLISKNCCSFSAEFLDQLDVGKLPAWVDRFARLASKGQAAGRELKRVGESATKFFQETKSALGELGGFLVKDVGNVMKNYWDNRGRRPTIGPNDFALKLPESAGIIHVDGDHITLSTMNLVPAIPEETQLELDPGPVFVHRVTGIENVDTSISRRRKTRCKRAPSAPFFPIGSVIEYQSASKGIWGKGKVLAYHPRTGLYDLDCKAQANPERMRWPAETNAPARESTTVNSGGAESVQSYAVGLLVEYDSVSHGRWLPTRVRAYDPLTGRYDLECRSDVLPSKMRLPTVPKMAAKAAPTLAPPVAGWNAQQPLPSPRPEIHRPTPNVRLEVPQAQANARSVSPLVDVVRRSPAVSPNPQSSPPRAKALGILGPSGMPVAASTPARVFNPLPRVVETPGVSHPAGGPEGRLNLFSTPDAVLGPQCAPKALMEDMKSI